MPHPQPQPYHWKFATSRQYRRCFLAINALLAAGIAIALPTAFATAAILILLPISTYIYSQHHALAGPKVELRFNSGQLLKLRHQADGSAETQAFVITACRWLGNECVVASGRLREERLGFLESHYLLLTADNSSEADRHRLAMYYQLGLLS
jgi:hypothetical protein